MDNSSQDPIERADSISEQNISAREPREIWARLFADLSLRIASIDRAGWLLLAGLAILAIFVWMQSLTIWEALLGAFALWATRLVLPKQTDRADQLSEIAKEQSTDLTHAIAVVDAIVSPTLILDNKAIIVHRNIAASAQFPAAQPGSPIAYSVRHPNFQSVLETARQTRLPEQAEFQQAGESGQWYRVSVTPFSLQPNAPLDRQLLLVVFENQTEQKQTENMRVDFVANASHELRTPLTSVMGFIDTLLGPAANDAEARERFLHIMRTQAERMSNLIEDLMSLSRIELRQHLQPAGSANLTSLLSEVTEALQGQIEAADLVVNLDLPENEVIVTGDRDELYQVFSNLLENAIKYGETGKKIDVQMRSDIGRNANAVRVTVTDYGPGIAAEHVPRLTERFYRVDAESSRKKKGTGLGLAIVKHIVRRHRGEMAIKSQLGLGTRVEVTLSK